jgi:energy-coupling factor transporter ATP-binding protein EcfA2
MATAEVKSDNALVLKNVGTIGEASFPLPESGVFVFRGPNGCGKSTAIRAIGSLPEGTKPGFTVRDRELKAEVSFRGVTLTLSRKATRKGELTVTIEGTSVDELVDPGIDNPESADAARIRALIKMSGQSADVSAFYDLCGGKEAFERMLPGIAAENDDDPVTLAGKIKRGLEARARESESRAELERGKALACHESAAGVDIDAPCDALALHAALEAAQKTKTELETRAKTAREARSRADHAKAQLEAQRAASASLPSVGEAQIAVEAKQEKLREAQKAIAHFEAELQRAKNNAQIIQTELKGALEQQLAAESAAKALAGWEASINDVADIEAPSDDQIVEATIAVGEAKGAIDTGTLVRKAKESLANCETHKRNAEAHASDAKGLRSAAGGVDGVLSAMVSKVTERLRVEGGRLVTDTARGKTCFAELSDGERYDIGIDLLVDRLGTDAVTKGIGMVQQRAWSELQPATKRRIADYARSRNVLIVTAEATDDEGLTAVAL